MATRDARRSAVTGLVGVEGGYEVLGTNVRLLQQTDIGYGAPLYSIPYFGYDTCILNQNISAIGVSWLC